VRDAMLQEYEVSADQCERDLLCLVGEMEQQGIAEVGA